MGKDHLTERTPNQLSLWQGSDELSEMELIWYRGANFRDAVLPVDTVQETPSWSECELMMDGTY